VATKKQRRRRVKERRHEYEYVYVDEEGRVVDVDEAEEEVPKSAKADDRARPRPARTGGRQRQMQPPSWRRVGKRALIFAPLMFLTVTLLAPEDVTLAQNVAQTLFLLAIFLPFSYAMDALTYRIWRKRTGQTEPATRRR
jgi:hypothetical protein